MYLKQDYINPDGEVIIGKAIKKDKLIEILNKLPDDVYLDCNRISQNLCVSDSNHNQIGVIDIADETYESWDKRRMGMKVFYKEEKNLPVQYLKHKIIKIDFCCEEMKETCTGGLNDYNNIFVNVQKEKDRFYLEYIDWTNEYPNEISIEFRYCPYCGERIEFIQNENPKV